MACGTPVVATRAGALSEVLEHTGGGLLTPRDDPAALAAGIDRLLADPALRTSLARRGREQVVLTYSWPQIARATADAYHEVIARRALSAARPARATRAVGRRAR